MDKGDLNKQANLAFDFMERLNYEVSYLIKEIEGLLSREQEEFVMGKGGGYAVTSPRGWGLESPDQWVAKRIGVFFVQSKDTKQVSGTITSFKPGLKVLCLGLTFRDKNVKSLRVILATLYDMENKSSTWKKFEHSINHIIQHQVEFFNNLEKSGRTDYEDNHIKFKSKYTVLDLFDLNNTEDIQQKLLKPALQQYRSIKK